MLCRFDAVKISGACRFVMRRVLLGGDGCTSGGRSERSMLMLCEWRLEGELIEECGGVDISITTAAMSSVPVL
jgi:hypothetical protein